MFSLPACVSVLSTCMCACVHECMCVLRSGHVLGTVYLTYCSSVSISLSKLSVCLSTSDSLFVHLSVCLYLYAWVSLCRLAYISLSASATTCQCVLVESFPWSVRLFVAVTTTRQISRFSLSKDDLYPLFWVELHCMKQVELHQETEFEIYFFWVENSNRIWVIFRIFEEMVK